MWEVEGFRRTLLTSVAGLAVAAVAATAAFAGSSNAAAYRAQVNANCRSTALFSIGGHGRVKCGVKRPSILSVSLIPTS